jgi:hypothetical protein
MVGQKGCSVDLRGGIKADKTRFEERIYLEECGLQNEKIAFLQTTVMHLLICFLR